MTRCVAEGECDVVPSVLPLSQAGADAVRQICELKEQHWPHSIQSQLAWWNANSGVDDLLVQLLDGRDLRAFLRLRNRVVLSGGKTFDALCATEVCVAKDAQGLGVGRTLLQAAKSTIVNKPTGIGYLLCRTEQQGFYRKGGWAEWQGNLVIRSSRGEEREPADDEVCFVADVSRLMHRSLTLIGDVF